MRAVLAASLCAAAVVSGCAEYSTAGGTAPEKSSSTPPAAGSELPRGSDPVSLDPADFTADITNEYLPLKAGNRWVYRRSTRTVRSPRSS